MALPLPDVGDSSISALLILGDDDGVRSTMFGPLLLTNANGFRGEPSSSSSSEWKLHPAFTRDTHLGVPFSLLLLGSSLGLGEIAALSPVDDPSSASSSSISESSF